MGITANWKKVWLIALVAWVFVVRCLSGCSAGRDSGDKVRDLDFTVVGDAEVPEDLKKTIEEKKTAPFKLTYSDDQGLYIVTGYGEQEESGYSIGVNALYLTDNSIVIDTELKGPESGESAGMGKSYPYIVVKTEVLENPVIFQ